MVPIGVTIVGIGGVLFLVVGLWGFLNIYSLFGPLMLMAFGMAILFPSTLAGSVSVFPRVAGAASALYGFIQMLTAAVTISIVGLLSDRLPHAHGLGRVGHHGRRLCRGDGWRPGPWQEAARRHSRATSTGPLRCRTACRG